MNSLRKYVGNQPLIMVGSTVLVLDEEKRLLMMKRSDNHTWDLPGGAMELGQAVEEPARRELLEEIGLEVNGLTFLEYFLVKNYIIAIPKGMKSTMSSLCILPIMFMEMLCSLIENIMVFSILTLSIYLRISAHQLSRS